MSDIKSAFEIAMEKVEKIGSATEEERLKWKYVPEGEKLAAAYLKEEDLGITAEMQKYDDKAKKFVMDGVTNVLLRNIDLPRNETIKKNNKKAMDGLRTLKKDKTTVENVYTKIRRIFNHYEEQGEQQRRQAYEGLKEEFQTKLQQAFQQQYGNASGMPNINMETQPQFQEEWRKLKGQLDSQYTILLDGYKQELSKIS